MSEYIRREDAMQIAFKSPFFSDALMEEIKALPSADVEKVCRCKDCKHHTYDEIFCCYWCEYPGMVRETTPDGFCDKGEE